MQGNKEFWDQRAKLGCAAGTGDLPLQEIEHEAIFEHVPDRSRVLDVGCGSGRLAVELARRLKCRVLGIDQSEAMIAQASEYAEKVPEAVAFEVGDALTFEPENFWPDVVVTKRMLINLPNAQEQIKAIKRFVNLPSVSTIVLCEASAEGLSALNSARVGVGLEEIVPPWHNVYLRSSVVAEAVLGSGFTVREIDFSSAYYFASRVLNAKLAQSRGVDPDYADEIPALFRLHPGDWNQVLVADVEGESMGQTRLWILDREEDPNHALDRVGHREQ